MDIAKLRDANDRELSAVYAQNRAVFLKWFAKNSKYDPSLHQEWYQDSFFIMLENLRTGKLIELTSSLATYLIAIGRNLERDHIKSAYKRHVLPDDQANTFQDSDYQSDETSAELTSKLTRALNMLDERCKNLLLLKYYHNYSLEAIALRLGYKNEDTAKKAKYLCMKHLKDHFKKL